jgi:uncharacterized protein (TIGR02118 family)
MTAQGSHRAFRLQQLQLRQVLGIDHSDRHVPFVQEIWAPESAEIDQGIDGPYEAAVHLRFASMEAMQAALMSERTGDVQADVANYTTIDPVLQISQIV